MATESDKTTEQELATLRATLLNTSGSVPLAPRFRALFTLRSLPTTSLPDPDAAVSIVAEALSTPGCASALLGHELAYVLGQMGRESALATLEGVLRDLQQHPMVRHEAAEAMGAISSESSLPILHEYLSDSNVSVRETCDLAIRKIQFDRASSSSDAAGLAQRDGAEFGSVDPAPGLPLSMHDTQLPKGSIDGNAADVDVKDVERMRKALLDEKASLFERYRAMFGLRNAAGAAKREEVQVAAVEALAEGFGDGSALFRHEVAYIFGQLVHPASVPSLLKVLRNRSEDEMVRHEAAEALGSIATPEVLPALREFGSAEETSRVVRESCEVALDMYEYENSGSFVPLHAEHTPAALSEQAPAIAVGA